MRDATFPNNSRAKELHPEGQIRLMCIDASNT